MYRTDVFTPSCFTSEGTMNLRGEYIHYHTVCEDNPFYDDSGKAIASVFSYSYFRSDVEDPVSRPVIFAYNGGPGSSSSMVHVGFLGAKRIKYSDVDDPSTLPPYEVIDNPDCLLDIADVVLVDPVATGYGVLLDESAGEKFFGIEEDAEALLTFISHWLSKYNRWGSPKYLIGESYGCTRSAVAAGMAADGHGAERGFSFSFDGVVLIGNTVTVGKYFNREVGVEPSVLQLPTCAAINWYHNCPSDQTVEEFVAEAKEFADTEYLLGLYKGDDLQGEELEQFTRKLSYYSGYSEEALKEHNYRLDENSARKEITKDLNIEVSRYDGRISLPKDLPHVSLMREERMDEAVSAKYGPYFHSALLGEVSKSLGITFDRTFVDSYSMYKKWNRETKSMNTGDYLRHAMHAASGFRTFFANGWYDLCTQIGIVYYTATHAGLPKERTFIKGYKSGHMVYLGEDNIHELCDDIHMFLEGKNPTEV